MTVAVHDMPAVMRHGPSDLRISLRVENVRDNVYFVKLTVLRNIKGNPVDAVRHIPAECADRHFMAVCQRLRFCGANNAEPPRVLSINELTYKNIP
jgi:hypothetical protein